ncbi:ORF23 [White spot syndrome virus]|uniref:Wsv477 n=7 Tax=White spot syndrome virus TaxID=342409 RepID=Q77IZ0_WSSVS|nr:wsv477 [Shrimp white spot syndrome virus]YP_009220635.1 hypothetical protein SWSSV_gp161 [White spot syndrome virus]AAK77692.1 ORF23 [White spot syndrome virus]AAL33478.1 wsv477 [Shrimp white spot syndrome virus]AAL88872.1 WSSV004 [Shrimp white spot syndrome virus]AFO63165.1 WSV477 [Shrimp white spot syndrome virus]ALN66279.1 hypothetical protein [White spot syndrome virus]
MYIFVEGSPLTGKSSWMSKLIDTGSCGMSFLNFLRMNTSDYYNWPAEIGTEHLQLGFRETRVVDGMFEPVLKTFVDSWKKEQGKESLKEYLDYNGQVMEIYIAEWLRQRPLAFHVFTYTDEAVKSGFLNEEDLDMDTATKWMAEIIREKRGNIQEIKVTPRVVFNGNVCSACFSNTKRNLYNFGTNYNNVVHCDLLCPFARHRIVHFL